MRDLVFVAAMGMGVVAVPSLAGGDASTSYDVTRIHTVASVVAAVNAKDAAAFTKLIKKLPLHVSDIAWDDPACKKQFSGNQVIDTDEMSAFVNCLAGAHLAANEEEPGQFQYGLGYRLELWAGLDGKIERLVSHRGASAPFIGQKLFMTHVKNAHLPSPAKPVDGRAGATLQVCVSAGGKVTSVAAEAVKTGDEPYAEQMAATAKGWTVEPFARDGKALPVCVHAVFAYPATALAKVQRDIMQREFAKQGSGGEEGGVAGGQP